MPVKEVLGKYTKEQIKKAAQIKAIFFDVDGVLTDGKIIYDDTGRESKEFNVKDGYIISHLKKAGILVGIITGRESKIVSNRAAELKLDFCHQGIMDKYAVFEKLIQFHKLKKKEVADARDYIKSRVDIVTESKGGQGVARDISDLVLAARGVLDKILKG